MLKITAQKSGWKANLLLTIFSVVFFFAIIELTLYLTGFNYSQFPRFMNIKTVDNYIDWQSSHGSIQHFIPHKKRMWAAMPDKGIVNSSGYIGKKIPLAKTPGVKRILFLGDSCTAGEYYYPDRAIRILNTRLGINAEPLIAATGGYSTYQGLDVLRETVKYKPDIVIAYFGWNDHWQALGGLPDHEYKEMDDLQLAIHNFSAKFRTYQLLHFLIYPPHEYFGKDSLSGIITAMDMLEFLRVPVDKFAANTREMIKIAQENKMQIYFIAAPMGPHINERENGLLPKEFIPPIHSRYNRLLEVVLTQYPDVHVISFKNTVFDKSLMMQDGIHPTGKGHEVIAEGVVKELMKTSGLKTQGTRSLLEEFAN